MKSFFEKNKIIILKSVLAACFIILFYIFLKYVFPYVSPFVYAFLFSLLLTPLSGFLEKKLKFPRFASALVSIIFFFIVIAGIGTGAAARIINEARSLFLSLSAYLNSFGANYEALKSEYRDILSFVPPEVQDTMDQITISLISSLAQSLGSGVSQTTGSLVTTIPGFLMSFIVTIISTFFILKDRDSISAWLLKYSPQFLKKKYSLIKKGVFSALMDFIKAQLVLSLLASAIITTGLLILRNPYALFLGLSIALVDMIPFFGAGLILCPWAAISFLSGSYALGASLIAIYLAVVLSRQIIEPHAKRIGMHPIITLIAIYLGLKFFGLPGLILGPLFLVAIKVIYPFLHIKKA